MSIPKCGCHGTPKSSSPCDSFSWTISNSSHTERRSNCKKRVKKKGLNTEDTCRNLRALPELTQKRIGQFRRYSCWKSLHDSKVRISRWMGLPRGADLNTLHLFRRCLLSKIHAPYMSTPKWSVYLLLCLRQAKGLRGCSSSWSEEAQFVLVEFLHISFSFF